MKILYRYVGTNLIKYFLILTVFFSVVIVSSQLLHLPSILYHAGFFKFLQILAFVNLSFLKFQLLFGFFISALLVGYYIRENREIYAVYACGISKSQLVLPVAVLSVFFVVLALVVSLFVVPFANRERAKFITLNVKKHILDSIVERNFMKLSENITVYVNKKNERHMEDVFIFNKKQGITITAEKAVFSDNKLLLNNGYIQIPSEDGFNLLKFKEYRFVLDVNYIKKYEFEDLDNKALISMIKTNHKDKLKALGVMAERLFFGIPFMFIGVLGFILGIQVYRSRDALISIVVLISIFYLVINTYFVKLIQKGVIHPAVYGAVLLVYFGGLTFYFYRKN
ncbi:LptF/LptG family permease [Persephonella sp.]